MKYSVKIIFVNALVILLPALIQAQQFTLSQTNKNGVYKKGEKYEVILSVVENLNDSLNVKIIKNYNVVKTYKIVGEKGGKVLLQGSSKKSVSYIVDVRLNDDWASQGLVVNPDKFKVKVAAPKNFVLFWKNEKEALRALDMQTKIKEIKNADPGYFCADVEINCTGPKPARGYLAKPKAAKPGSLPIVLNVHAAGVKGSWCLAKPENALYYAKKGALCFDLNAHGMLNGQPQQYYDELEEGELKNYYYQGIENRDSFYFKGMYLRLMRTLDFLCTLPEWDGKRILVVGESQGGGQSLAAAGLDKRVSAVVATVPAMCNWSATLTGSKGGWPNPFAAFPNNDAVKKSVPYFDAAYLLKNSKATLVVEVGLIDYTCPSNSILAAINQSKGKKILFTVPYRGHHVEQKEYQKIWGKTVYQPKMKFIDNFLK